MLRVFEAFSGIGAPRVALKRLNVAHEVVGVCEIDKYAIQSYEAIHGKTYNVGDITKVDANEIPAHDLFLYGFPCTDISVAGKQKGIVQGVTRSGLLYECQKIIEAKKPRVLIMENVKNLIGKNHIEDFNNWLTYLESLGYANYWSVENATQHGTPQSRERIFCVSILGEHKPIEFKYKRTLQKRLKDILEKEVDEKYFLSHERTKDFTFKEPRAEAQDEDDATKIKVVGSTDTTKFKQNNTVYDIEGVAPTILARDYKDAKRILLQKETFIEKVKVRKFDIDKDEFLCFIKRHKKESGLKLHQIADALQVPKTEVEHWFRKDKYFSFPCADVWHRLKEILNIQENTFDDAITVYEYKDNVYDLKNRVYHENGISPTLLANASENNVPKIKVSGMLSGKHEQSNRVYETDGIAPTLCAQNRAKNGGFNSIKILEENTIIEDFYPREEPRCYTDIAPTLRATRTGLKVVVKDEGENMEKMQNEDQQESKESEKSYRIRKLTPLECWRLMDFSDEDFNKAKQSGVSNTQLYKQAGNSISVNTIEDILKEVLENVDF